MPNITIDFYANKIKGLAPLDVIFYPIIELDSYNFQDTTDSTELLQDTTDSESLYQII